MSYRIKTLFLASYNIIAYFISTKIMKRIFLLSLIALFTGKNDNVFGQQPLHSSIMAAKPRKANYTSFTQPTVIKNEEALRVNKGFENDPELGVLYPNAPCKHCYEDISKRTETAKTFVKAGSNGTRTITRSSNFPLHYRDTKGQWRTMRSELNPISEGVYATENQPVKLLVNAKEHYSSITNKNNTSIAYNRDLELVYIKADGSEQSLGSANWSSYTAGDDGVYVKEAWPGIDIEINMRPGGIKTNFSINHPLPAYADGKLVLRDHMQLSNGLSMNVPAQKDYNGEVKVVNSTGEVLFNISNPVAYERFDNSKKMTPLTYSVEKNNIVDINVPGDLLNKALAYYPLIIDPLITTGIVAGPNFSPYYPAYCTNTNTVTIPLATTISDVQYSYAYAGNYPAATNLNQGGYLITVGTCQSPPLPYNVESCTGSTLLYYCGPTAVSIYSDVATCMPVISCTAYNLTFTIGCTQEIGTTGGLCSTHYFFSDAPFEIDIYGVTSALPVAISGPTSVCLGGTMTLSDGASTGWPWSSSNTAVATIDPVSGLVTGVGLGTTTITYGYAPCAVTETITVIPITPINGMLTTCIGATTTLTDATGGGAWSTTAGTGSVTVVGGVVTGSTAGTAHVTYTYPSGCIATAIVTVSASTTPILGTLTMCQGATTSLTDATGGGTWTSSNTGVATIGTGGGTVLGAGPGTATITYAFSAGCLTTVIVTVTATPGPILGTLSVCQGLTTLLSDAIAGGTWSNTSGTGSITVVGGLVTGSTAGTATVTYSEGGSCYKTAVVTVNTSPAAIQGVGSVCVGLTTSLTDPTAGGTWSSSNTGVATVGTGAGLTLGVGSGTSVITYTMPGNCYVTKIVTVNPAASAILGTLSVCQGLTTSLSNVTGGGTWSTTAGSGSVSVVGGVVTGSTSGTATVTYTYTTGCYATAVVTVNPSPSAILGPLSLCQGTTTPLTDAAGGGTWVSSNTAVGTVATGGGGVYGVGPGTSTITYSLSAACYTTAIVTVIATPTAILGNTGVCQLSTTSLSDAVSGGTWSTTNGSGSVTVVGGTVTGSTVGTATVTYSFGGSCYQTTTVTVYTIPTAILGNANVCSGLTTSLTDAIAGGTWSSSNTGVATIASTGIVTGVGAGGTATIIYTMPGNCAISTVVTVNPAPSAILGVPVVCQGLTTSLSNTVTGGTWNSGNTSVATITGGGIVSGVAGGTSIITYTSTNCTPVTVVVTVNPVSPIVSSTLAVCSGLSISLSDVIGGGTWSSSNTGVATVGSSSGTVTGLGTGGTSTILYTFTTNCTTSVVVTVNPSPVAISGATTLCFGGSVTLTDATGGGGTWSSSNTGVATIGSATGTITTVGGVGGTTTITYALATGCNATTTLTVNPSPAPISGNLNLCVGLSTTLTDATGGGSWSSNNTVDAPIGSASGTVVGMATGTGVITYMLGTGCYSTAIVTVNVSPVAISGNHSMCLGVNTSLSDPTLGGTWSSSNTANVTIGSGTGLAYGAGLGTSTITYTLAGCTATTTVTVNIVPNSISGPDNGCAGFTATLSDGTPGGTWSSSNTGVATIGSSSGSVLAIATGNTTISYTLNTGCFSSMVFTVNPSPLPISGTPYICQGTSFIFGDSPGGGTWSSTNTGIATVGTSGLVAGVNPGVATIIYTLPTTCFSTYNVTITPAPTPIGGPSSVCIGYAITLTDGVSGGTWSVTNATGAATISTSGVVTGVSTGIVAISYTTFACNPAVYAVSVNPLPSAIMGVGNLCEGSSTSLTDATVGGTWSSNDASVSVSSTGVVSVDTGSGAIISYTLPTGCYVTVPVVVYPNPSPILGVDSICQGQSLVLSDITPGGVWSSSDGTIALSIAFTGEVDGVVAGTVHISYTLISGCYVTVPFKVIEPLPASLTISQSPDSILCHNAPVTLTADPVNAGAPTYEWKLFGTIYMGTGDTLRYDPTHGDFVTCVMTTHSVCAAPAVVSKDITLNVYPLVAPVVTISTLGPDTSSYLGQVYTFYTDVTYGGFSPTFQWYVDRDSIPGATNSTFTTRLYNENDTVYCVVHGTSPCDTVTYVGLSNQIVIEGKGYLSASSLSATNDLSLFPNPNTGSFVLSGTLTTGVDKDVTLEVSDMLGRTVYNGKTTPRNGAVRAEINLAGDISAGTYLLRVYTETGIQTFHFVVGK